MQPSLSLTQCPPPHTPSHNARSGPFPPSVAFNMPNRPYHRVPRGPLVLSNASFDLPGDDILSDRLLADLQSAFKRVAYCVQSDDRVDADDVPGIFAEAGLEVEPVAALRLRLSAPRPELGLTFGDLIIFYLHILPELKLWNTASSWAAHVLVRDKVVVGWFIVGLGFYYLHLSLFSPPYFFPLPRTTTATVPLTCTSCGRGCDGSRRPCPRDGLCVSSRRRMWTKMEGAITWSCSKRWPSAEISSSDGVGRSERAKDNLYYFLGPLCSK